MEPWFAAPASFLLLVLGVYCHRNWLALFPEDPPGAGRHQHVVPMPMAGWVPTAVAIAAFAYFGESEWIAGGVALASLTGYLDDRGKSIGREMTWRVKGGMLTAATALALVGAAEQLQRDPVSLIVAFLWLFAVTNAVNFMDNTNTVIKQMINHPDTFLGLGDGGAHCGMLCDASMTTHMMSRWASTDRTAGDLDRLPLEEVVRMLTSETADAVGLGDRGMIRVGNRADLNIIDLDNIGLRRPAAMSNLPDGARMIGQGSTGYDATIVAGAVTYRNGEATGALPGRLVRGARPRLN